ncbi:hypothetical protein EW146_g5766 [Bondarzewia mesenterica]|uniref:Uncharacterized protein n=1 Tax=Bondarzewia mesenterica TaxID=1095465 RepID=A0A4S4LQH9_9AGAM|nr:hypothetical protein EW146_g5766 [Bondarzewia mesenterica]
MSIILFYKSPNLSSQKAEKTEHGAEGGVVKTGEKHSDSEGTRPVSTACLSLAGPYALQQQQQQQQVRLPHCLSSTYQGS